jgi:hypothetical protein
MMPYIALKKQSWMNSGNYAIPLDYPELDRYIDVYYEEKITDWSKPQGKGRFTSIRGEVHRCLDTDFGPDEGAVDAFATWEGWSIACIDFDSVKGGLQGDKGTMVIKELTYKIDRCSNEKRKPGSQPCKSGNEIEDFISDM